MAIASSKPDNGPFDWSITVSSDHSRSSLSSDLSAFLEALPKCLEGNHVVQIWLEEVQDGDDALIADLAIPYRELLQLRLSLPVTQSRVNTRPFNPDEDTDPLIQLNNRAFDWHPEQGGLTVESLRATTQEEWFNPEGLRILELEDRMAGFCWTKVHDGQSPALGEIYVIALDPDFHGRGLGVPMTRAGLDWLSVQGIEETKLYVEADNHVALRTYNRIGFSRYASNRAYTSDLL